MADSPSSGYAEGAAGRIEWGGVAVGYVGKIERAVAEKLSLREIPAAAELDLVRKTTRSWKGRLKPFFSWY